MFATRSRRVSGAQLGPDPAPSTASTFTSAPAPVPADAGTTADFRALGTGIRVVVTDPGVLAAAVDAVRHELNRVDAACSRFRDDSDLSRANAAAGRAVDVGVDFIDALDVAFRASRLTGGIVDPTLGRTLAGFGYDRDFALIERIGAEPAGLAGAAGPAGPRAAVGNIGLGTVPGLRRPTTAVEVDRLAMTVRVPTGVALDLGATAKAWAVDRAAAAGAARIGAAGILVSAGGDLAVAGPPPMAGWPVRITDDHAAAPDAPGQTIAIRSGGLATSSTAVRRWTRGGQPLHHVLDPRTLRPATPVWRTVSVTAATCVDANIASTAAVVLGWEASRWLARLGLPALLVGAEGNLVRVAGWPEPDPDDPAPHGARPHLATRPARP
ncbi:MAG: FAD:protein FMN transferase [Frankia sp.]